MDPIVSSHAACGRTRPAAGAAEPDVADPDVTDPDVTDPAADTRTRHAPQYKVLIHNDSVTPMPFVVSVLTRQFRCFQHDAQRIMLEAHHKGLALVEVVPLEHAELHVEQAHSLARGSGYPLTFTIEPA